ncbi:hypothetical protein [Homoserinimonas sp. OAct 916]|uniref:hypothetical protein n=1 Tax=Homoserinimonas sp. OAct 916 TaxID=2211450 RepID=UPI000DBE397F|nr:hypothetical protein [Homoserinimonas sp. OAct 916]
MNAAVTANQPHKHKAARKEAKTPAHQEFTLVIRLDSAVTTAQLLGLQKSLTRLVESVIVKVDLDLADAIFNETAEIIEEPKVHGVALTQDQVDFLTESGSVSASDYDAAVGRVAGGSLRSKIQTAKLSELADSLSTTEVAKMLEIDSSRVRHRQGSGGLYSYLVGRNRRYPSWQFNNEDVLPGLKQVIKAFPNDTHPATIRGLMTTPQEDLVVSEHPVTPVDWLVGGGDRQAVLDVIEGYHTS